MSDQAFIARAECGCVVYAALIAKDLRTNRRLDALQRNGHVVEKVPVKHSKVQACDHRKARHDGRPDPRREAARAA